MKQIGKGFAGAFKLCSTLNLPRLTKTAYKNQEAKLLKVVQKVAEESNIKAATEIVEKQQNLSSDIVKCGISVDGTWQRRGYTSMNGCVAAISVESPLISTTQDNMLVVEGRVMDGMASIQLTDIPPSASKKRITVLLPSLMQIDDRAALLNGLWHSKHYEEIYGMFCGHLGF
ncbi:uncharacterized protein TNCV_1030021 [Trichonephila clavipes]|nr:uncharacterized protein TNCV_1030021 [Trichonephila clavipes]